MNGKTILKDALERSGMKQSDLARKFNLSMPTISANMRRDRISLDVFVNYLNAMGYSVFVGTKTGEMFVPEWEVEEDRKTQRQ